MKAASTALVAYAVTPKTRPSWRCHSTWYTSALKPDAKYIPTRSGPAQAGAAVGASGLGVDMRARERAVSRGAVGAPPRARG
jgi:hypothetical protein